MTLIQKLLNTLFDYQYVKVTFGDGSSAIKRVHYSAGVYYIVEGVHWWPLHVLGVIAFDWEWTPVTHDTFEIYYR